MKNLNFRQKLALIIMLLICVSLLFLFWYKHTYSEVYSNTHEVSSSSLDRKLLIAAMRSPFKDSVRARVLNRYASFSVIVEVIDISALENTDTADFDAILIMHRWEAGAPTESMQSFMNKNLRLKNKMVILTTSWNGLENMENVDAITGASIVEDVPIFTDQIIKRLDRLLKYKN